MTDSTATWVPHKTADGRTYYHNLSTGEVSWSLPDPTSSAAPAGGQWEKHTTPDGQTFYHNRKTGESSWVVPKEGKVDPAPVGNGQWMPHKASDGRTFYQNVATGKVSWTIPTDADGGTQTGASTNSQPGAGATSQPGKDSSNQPGNDTSRQPGSDAAVSPATPAAFPSVSAGPLRVSRPSLPRGLWPARGACASSGGACGDRKPAHVRHTWSLLDVTAWVMALMGAAGSRAYHMPQRLLGAVHGVCHRWPRLWRWCLLRAYPGGRGEGMAIHACPVDDVDATFADGVPVSEVVHVATQPFALISKTRPMKMSVAGSPPPSDKRAYALGVYLRELATYPRAFLTAAGCERVVVASELTYDMDARTAVPDSARCILFLNANLHSEQYLRLVLHHDLFHMADYMIVGPNYVHGDAEWQALNAPGFRYGTGGESMQGDHNVQGLGTGGPGFLNKYATSSPAEDKAETFAALMCCPSALDDDPILRAKADLLKKRVEVLCPAMTGVWGRVRESVRAKTACVQRGEWEERTGPTGHRYWYHKATRMTSVVHPEVAPVPNTVAKVAIDNAEVSAPATRVSGPVADVSASVAAAAAPVVPAAVSAQTDGSTRPEGVDVSEAASQAAGGAGAGADQGSLSSGEIRVSVPGVGTVDAVAAPGAGGAGEGDADTCGMVAVTLDIHHHGPHGPVSITRD
eukprot:jgi/Mesvir1/23886/Mv10675-RA.1